MYRSLSIALCISLLTVSALADAPLQEESTVLFEGVRYIHQVRMTPVRQVIHLIEINLEAAQLRFMTTPANGPEAPGETWCETTYEFVRKMKAQIGINANYFYNDREKYAELLGLAASNGDIVSRWDEGGSKYALNISKENEVTFLERPENAVGTTQTIPEVDLYNTVSGKVMLLKDGKILVEEGGSRHPRTAIGKSRDNKLFLFVVDGRQPRYSAGMNCFEVARFFIERGVSDALALDGGGSSTLVIANPDAKVMNVPMPIEMPSGVVLTRPGLERKNGNNLVLFAAPLSDTTASDVVTDTSIP
ncbi:MAG: phosphodiester glycosidase family protein [Candidatus Hydrogenedentales bacterium]